jgi:hypothetical protein
MMESLSETGSEFKKAKAIMEGEPATDKVADGVKQARQYLQKAANLYNLTVKCVDKVVAPNVPPIAQTGEMFRAAVGTLFIEAARAGFVRIMPEKPMEKKQEESP